MLRGEMNALCTYILSVYQESSILMHSTHWCPLCCPEELRFICSLLEYWLQFLVEALRHETLNDSQDRKCRECQTTKNLWDKSELSCGFSNSLQAFAALSSLLASNPSLGKDFDSSPYPRLRPAVWHAWGAWRDPITSRSNQVTVLPQAYTGIYLLQKQTPCSHSRQQLSSCTKYIFFSYILSTFFPEVRM